MPPLQPPEIGNVTTTQDYDSFCGEGSNCEKFLFGILKQWYLVLMAFVLILYLIILCSCSRNFIWNTKCCCLLVWFFESTAVNDCFKASPLKCFYIVTREMVDTTEFEKGFKNIICSFPNILQREKEIVVTEEMYKITPELIETSFEGLCKKIKTEEKEKGPPADKHENSNDEDGNEHNPQQQQQNASDSEDDTDEWDVLIPPQQQPQQQPHITTDTNDESATQNTLLARLLSCYRRGSQHQTNSPIQLQQQQQITTDTNDERTPLHPRQQQQITLLERLFSFFRRGSQPQPKPQQESESKSKPQPESESKSKSKPESHTNITDKFPVDIENGIRLTAIIGDPGCGKTVYMETLRSFYIKEGLYPFLIPFRGLKNDEEKMTFPEFLFKYRGFSGSTDFFDDKKTFGSWIKNNKSKIIILLDGLDEYHSDIDEGVPLLDMNNSATVKQWISLIFKKDTNSFMSGIKVVFTSRPSTIHRLSGACRPSVYYEIKGLTSDISLKSVIMCYNSKTPKKIFKFVKNNGPNIRELANNPFILALISLLHGENKITSKTTIPQLYDLAFKQLRRSPHRRGEWNDDQEKIVDRFWYKMFEGKNKLQFTEADFDVHIKQCNEARKEKDQEALLVTLADLETFSMIQIQSKFSTDKVEAKDKDIEPKHRTIQEFHVARYMVRSLELETFKTQVEGMFQNAEDDKFKMIRRFLTYFIYNFEGDEKILEKKNFFKTFLYQHLRKIFGENGPNDAKKHQMQIMADLLDLRDDGTIHEIQENLKEFIFRIYYRKNSPLDVAAQGLNHFMKNFVAKVQVLHLDLIKQNVGETRELFQTIQKLSSKIEDIEIKMKPEHIDPLSELVALFPHLTRKLESDGDGDNDERRLCRKLMEEIINFDTSKLQTQLQEMKVEVDGFLEVAIRRGKPLQFNTADIDIRESTDDEVREFFQTIHRSSTTIEDLEIVMDAKQHQCLNELVEIFPHFTGKLKLELDGGYDDRRQFNRKLKKEINNFDTSKLQTQELKVVVWLDYSTILLEVVIRRGEPLQFNKVDIDICELTDDEVREFFQKIKRSSTTNEDMLIWMDAKQHQYMKELVEIFPHLTKKLELMLGGDDDRRQFCRKLMKEIIKFDTSKLQTQELKVEVVGLLEVVIRPGEPLQFIKE